MPRHAKRTKHKVALIKPIKLPRRKLLFWGVVACLVYLFVFGKVFLSPRNTIIWKALFSEYRYPDGFSVRGIDISHHQGTVDWDKLRSALIDGNPIRFVIVKATQGNAAVDSRFASNFTNAMQYGLVRGAYHYFSPQIDAKSQASHFIANVNLQTGDLPPILDFEETGSMTPRQTAQAALSWLETVEKHYGVKPILYTNYKFKLKYFSGKEFEQYPYWIAHYYVDTLKYQGKWKFWQHTDCGKVSGISTRVDLNVYNGSMYDLEKFTIPEQYARKQKTNPGNK